MCTNASLCSEQLSSRSKQLEAKFKRPAVKINRNKVTYFHQFDNNFRFLTFHSDGTDGTRNDCMDLHITTGFAFVAKFDFQNTIPRLPGPQCKAQSYFFAQKFMSYLATQSFLHFVSGSRKSFAYTKTDTLDSRTLDIRAKKLK